MYWGGHKGAELIDQGPYSISRNPLYLFSMLAVAGIGAQSGSLLLGPILALFVYAVFNNVIDEEERLLRKVFGQAYIDYCEIGRASCRERVCQYVLISVVAVT